MFDNLQSLYFGPDSLAIKRKKAYFGEINGKWLIIKGVKKIIFQHPAHFWPFLKTPAENLTPHSQIILKVDLIIWVQKRVFLINAMLTLKKLVFRLLELHLK